MDNICTCSGALQFCLCTVTRKDIVMERLLKALNFVVNRENLMFAECTDAEEILLVCKEAIAQAEGK